MLVLLIIVPLGFSTKFYSGPAAGWVNDSLGGLLYIVFWCLLVFLFFPSFLPRNISVGVLLSTCLLEILQLWHPPFLELIRSNFIGRTVLGTTFVWSDFFYYVLGAAFSFLIMRISSKNA